MATRIDLNKALHDESFRKKLIPIAYSKTKDIDRAKDAVSRAFLDALELKDEELNKIEDINKWLSKITVYKAIDEFKSGIKTEEIKDTNLADKTKESNQKDMELIRHIVSKKCTKQDLFIFDKYLEGYSYKEIGEMINQTEAYVRKRMFIMRIIIKNGLGLN